MSKIMEITLEITVDDLPDKYREELKEFMDLPEDEDLPTVDDYKSWDIADLFNERSEDLYETFFEGSDIFVKFSKVAVKSSKWKED